MHTTTTIIALRNVLRHNRSRHLLRNLKLLDDWADILTLTGVVLQDDLLVVVSARHTSLSYNSEFEKLPLQLSRYFAGNNFIVLFPEQFGEENEQLTFTSDPLSIDVQHNYTRFTTVRDFFEKFSRRRKLWNHRRQKTQTKAERKNKQAIIPGKRRNDLPDFFNIS